MNLVLGLRAARGATGPFWSIRSESSPQVRIPQTRAWDPPCIWSRSPEMTLMSRESDSGPCRVDPPLEATRDSSSWRNYSSEY